MATEIPEERWERLTESKKREITRELFSAEVPWGLYNVVPQSMRDALEMVDPRWMNYREETVAKKADVTEKDENFRLSFWTEYNTSKDLDKPFSLERAMAGVCSKYYYKHNILKKPRLLAYIVYPPTNYMAFMRSMLYKGQQRMRDIMKVSAVKEVEVEVEDKKTGKLTKKTTTEVDMKLANLQLKTFALLDNRVKGAIVQRVKVEQKNLNVNVDGSKMLDATPTSVIDIDKQLLAIDREIARNEESIKTGKAIHGHVKTQRASDIEIDIIPPASEKKQ